LLIRSLQQLGHVNPGFQPERILSLRVAAPPIGQFRTDPFVAYTYHERILEAVRGLPQIEAAAFGTSAPLTWNVSTMAFYRDGRPVPAPGEFPAANSHFVTTDYFRTMGIPLLRGRAFDGRERQPTIPAGSNVTPETMSAYYQGITLDGLISQRTAEKYWPGEDPIGKRFRLGFSDMHLPWVEIIGIVGNTTQEGPERGEEAEFYLTQRQLPLPMTMHLMVRTRLAPSVVIASVRAAVASVAKDQPIFDVKPMGERMAEMAAGRRFNMSLYTFFAGLALLLAVIGLYGVLAFTVSQRTREVGIRMALGARRLDVLWHVLGRGLALVLPGTALGLLGAWGLSRALRSQLFGVVATDLLTYTVCACLLLLAALAACLLPARRAMQVEPMQALRWE
jgi:predicted permease